MKYYDKKWYTAMRKLLIRYIKYIYPIFIILILSTTGAVYYRQQSKINSINNQIASLSSQNKKLSGNISSLTYKLGNEQKTIKYKPKTPVYHIGDTQCINGLCITLDSFDKVSENVCGACSSGTVLWHAVLTVTNKGQYPSLFTLPKSSANQILSYIGITSGSHVYTNDNLFWPIFVPGSGGATFVNDYANYPKQGKTITGSVAFQLPASEVVDSYLYGNLTWIL